jgi:tetratricopeptide (TPR) repeat protein
MPKEQAVSDLPGAHYLQGKQYLEQGDLQEAAGRFQSALSLNPDYAPAYEGMGLVQLVRGDFLEAQYYFEEARRRDDTFAPLYIGLGRVLLAQGDDQRAVSHFQRALELEPNNADAFFYLGKTYVNLGQYSRAEESFKKALDSNPAHVQASEEWALLVRERTPTGDLPHEYVAITKKPFITRADLAALLAHQLPLQELCGSAQETVFVSDIQTSWAREAIGQVVLCGLMTVNTDGEFEPREQVTRLECALVVTQVLLKSTADSRLIDPFEGLPSPYQDVSADHEAFGAIMLATTRGIIEAKGERSFGPDEVLNGYEAMKMVRALRDQL